MKRWMNILLTAVLLIGVGLLGYGGYQYFDMKIQNQQAEAAADDLLDQRGETSKTSQDDDPMTVAEKRRQFLNSDQFGQGKSIGKLKIPKLDGDLPIVEGVGEDDLAKGVGRDDASSMPLSQDQTVLSGHRDTVFRGMGRLEKGDTMTVSLPYGDFQYKITDMHITDADDRSIIVPHDQETLTLTTCYPFDFIGNAPNRYIVNTKPMFDPDKLSKQPFSAD